ncbi:hypothetical protein [Chitinophaga sp. 212800010-3]|uniref:hypothetical protein n=1 Tax=unclassified Chitinophaga TaxID=2619133 RepID=UPI002DE2779C|nr:NHL repeat-containing protein [Chitinophaga sp. 212800010-3]
MKHVSLIRKMGACVSVLLVLLGAGCKKPEAQLSSISKKNQQLELAGPIGDSSIPVAIYIAPNFSMTTDVQYQMIRDANVDLIIDISDQATPTDKLTMLNMASNHGLKMIVADQRVNGTDADITAMVNTYMNHPATAGYYIKDEPTVSQLQDAATRYNKILAVDNAKIPHVNLFPSYATGALGSINYETDYVDAWIQKVGPSNLRYLSMDDYPFLSNGTFREVPYFNDLDVIRRLGLKYHIKTSAYLQSIGSSIGLRRPNADELRYSVYSTLAYGVKLPVWFTYITPVNNFETFTNGIIDMSGNKTDLYDPFAALNAQMRQLGRVLSGTDAIAVYHTGTSIPTGTSRPPANFLWQVQGAANAVIISDLVNPVTGKEYIMVVNKSFVSSNTFTFNTGADVANVTQVSRSTGLEDATNFSAATHVLSDNFLPGEGKLYALQKAPVAAMVSTLAGSGTAGFADGQGVLAQFNFTTNTGLATDAAGNIYVADINNHCIRKITPAGAVTTFAGSPGVQGKTDGTGTGALFDHPAGVATDAGGNVYVADSWNWAVRKITPAGVVSTVLGWVVPFPHGITVDKNTGKVYTVSALTSAGQGKLYEISAAGAMTTRSLSVPVNSGGITMDSQGNLVIADNLASVIYKVNTSSWSVTTIAGVSGQTGWADGVGSNARFEHPWGITLDAADNIYVAGCGHQFDAPLIADSASRIRRIEAGTNKVVTIAGSAQGYADGAGGVARFTVPTGIATAGNGVLYVLDRYNQRIRKITLQ